MKKKHKKLIQVAIIFVLLFTILSRPNTANSLEMQENTDQRDEVDEQPEEEQPAKEQPVEETKEEQSEEEQPEQQELELQENFEMETPLETSKEQTIEKFMTGEVEEVSTFEELRLAIANPEVSRVEVMNNLVRSGTGLDTAIGTINRNLLIRGNGYSINFGADNGSLFLGELADGEKATLRVENVITVKAGNVPLYNATSNNSVAWTLELENVHDTSPRFASLELGKVDFTGGENSFKLTAGTVVLLEAKDIVIRGGSEVLIDRGNASVFNTAATVQNSSISLQEGSTLNITTASGNANTINIAGDNATIDVRGNSSFILNTPGPVAVATDTTNNGIRMAGLNPSIKVSENSLMDVTTTQGKRGIGLYGNGANLLIENGTLNMNLATASAVHVMGAQSSVNFNQSIVTMNYTTGRGVVVNGVEPSLNLYQSDVSMIGSGASEGIQLLGRDALLLLDNKSTLDVSSEGAGTLQNIVIGNNNENPKLHILGSSKLKVSTGSGTAAAATATNTALNIRGSNPEVILGEGSMLDITITSGARRGVSIDGANAKINVAEKSKINITGDTGDMFRVIGNSSEFAVENAEIMINNTSGRGLHLSGTAPTFTATDSIVNIIGTTNVRLGTNGNNASIDLHNSQLTIESSNGANIHMTDGDSKINIAKESTVILESNNAKNIFIDGDKSLIDVSDGSKLTTTAGNSDSIHLNGNYATMKVRGNDTFIHASSNVSATYYNATVHLGRNTAVAGVAAGVIMEVTDGAEMTVESGRATALMIQGSHGNFNVLNEGIFNVKSADSSDAAGGSAAPVRFVGANGGPINGDHTFTIDNAEMTITKTGGTVPGIRMFGNRNAVIVQNGGKFVIDNPGGTGNASNGGVGLGNQGIHYSGGDDSSFTVDGIGSEVRILAANGPAIDMENRRGKINVLNGGYFQTEGRTLGEANGIFNAGVLEVTFDNPLFMDFRNNRSGGGNIFNVSATSRLVATNSDLSVWGNGVDLDGDPDLNFVNLDYTFTGLNFSILEYSSKQEELNIETFGAGGFGNYSRMSSNNARWAIVDELRVPTDADRFVYGRVSMPIGIHYSRPAWEGEAIVEVEVERLDGSIEKYFGITRGHTYENTGISIYGEEPRGGLFEIELKTSLQEGEVVRVVGVGRVDRLTTNGFDNVILVDEVRTFPVVPPTPAKASDYIATSARVLRGFSENPEVDVFVKHNGEWIDTTGVKVDANGNFEVSLEDLTLHVGDQLQVFLQDKKGSAEAAGVINPPVTNSQVGNINPETSLEYHDTIFLPATIVTVDDLGPVSPVDPLDPETPVNPENPPVLPENQGHLSIDFISRFNFGVKQISAVDTKYYALPQRLLDEDNQVIEGKERPNYIQISDNRSPSERHGWELSVTQDSPFINANKEELRGAQLRIKNAELITAQGGQYPNFVRSEFSLTAGNKKPLITTEKGTGKGLWVYRFGNEETMGSSIVLEVPGSATPNQTTYSTKLHWELSAVPENR